jgi:uncharacterized protein YxjI
VLDPNAHDRFVLRQRVKLVINQYIRFFTDSSKSQELMRILARQRFDPRARYDVTDDVGGKIGEIQKEFGASLLRSTFTLYDGAGTRVALVRERSVPVAVGRRAVQLIPYVDSVADWLPIPYDFEFLDGEEVLGILRRRRGKLRDVYDLDLSADTEHRIDRRLALATAVGMDALQAR